VRRGPVAGSATAIPFVRDFSDPGCYPALNRDGRAGRRIPAANLPAAGPHPDDLPPGPRAAPRAHERASSGAGHAVLVWRFCRPLRRRQVGVGYGGDQVLDTVGIKRGPFAMVDMYGTPHSATLHVVERYRLVDYDDAKDAMERNAKENSYIAATAWRSIPTTAATCCNSISRSRMTAPSLRPGRGPSPIGPTSAHGAKWCVPKTSNGTPERTPLCRRRTNRISER
jgi:hypothetical protein